MVNTIGINIYNGNQQRTPVFDEDSFNIQKMVFKN